MRYRGRAVHRLLVRGPLARGCAAHSALKRTAGLLRALKITEPECPTLRYVMVFD